jgi:LEA14-like dessication related protein
MAGHWCPLGQRQISRRPMKRAQRAAAWPLGLHRVLPLAAIVVLGCSTLAGQQPPVVQVVGLTLLEANSSGQRFRVRLSLENANAEPITVTGIKFRVRLGGEGYLDGQATRPTDIAAAASKALSVDVTSELVSSLSRLIAIVQGPAHTLPYDLDGELYLASRSRSPVPFHASGEVPLAMMQGTP